MYATIDGNEEALVTALDTNFSLCDVLDLNEDGKYEIVGILTERVPGEYFNMVVYEIKDGKMNEMTVYK